MQASIVETLQRDAEGQLWFSRDGPTARSLKFDPIIAGHRATRYPKKLLKFSFLRVWR